MTFKDDLYEHLSTDAGIIAEVSTRIFFGIAPTSTAFPYITLERIASPGHNHMLASSAIANPLFQFDCWALTSVKRETVSEAVREALDGLRGVKIGTNDTTDIRRVFVDNQSDSTEDPREGTEDRIFRTRMDITIWYVRSVPTF